MASNPLDVVRDDGCTRTATVDELTSDDFETLPGQKADCELAAQRLAAWCAASSAGDWARFFRRLVRDGTTVEDVLARFATARRRPHCPLPGSAAEALWVKEKLSASPGPVAQSPAEEAPCPFEDLFLALVTTAADERLWASTDVRRLRSSARQSLTRLLLADLTELCAPILYRRFQETTGYATFVAHMRTEGWDRLLESKPVLLRLITSLVGQWIDMTREFVTRLNRDLEQVRRDLLDAPLGCAVVRVSGRLSDRHHGGRSVLRVEFEDGRSVMYKPKDLRLDVAWRTLVERLNATAPVDLRTVKTLACDGYGWTEVVEHGACATADGVARFFRRSGAWLALFHTFAAGDMHHENIIAAGDHPVPVDLENLLQPGEKSRPGQPGMEAFDAAVALVAESVTAVSLLPSHQRTRDGMSYSVGGVASAPTRAKEGWREINSDGMAPEMREVIEGVHTNLPRVGDRHAEFGEHVDDFMSGFEDYASFLQTLPADELFEGFNGLTVRRILRPTHFYFMLLERLKDEAAMSDGPRWSAQADFVARFADWDNEVDPDWPLLRVEREALVALDVPLFTSVAALTRATSRFAQLDTSEVAWQVEIIRQVSAARTETSSGDVPASPATSPNRDTWVDEANMVAADIQRFAVRRGASAAWVGLRWFPNANQAPELNVVGNDLYAGSCGVGLFLAAHARTTGSSSSADLALASVAHLRAELKTHGAAHVARLFGTGGADGLGSFVYGLTTIAELLDDRALLDDALVAARLISPDIIASDTRLDVIGGSAGAILGLLRLHARTQEPEVLARAVRSGEHLLAQPRIGPPGRRSWLGAGAAVMSDQPMNGMSHGAAGFAYALASLAQVTGREDFAEAATECIEYERSHYDPRRQGWRDFSVDDQPWPAKWCHGAVGIGLARLGMMKRRAPIELGSDVDDALAGATLGWPGVVDTLCCGSLGMVEFLGEAANVLERQELMPQSQERLATVLEGRARNGDYRWNGGARRFNLGLFCGLAGVGYTCLRRVDASLPNVLLWE